MAAKPAQLMHTPTERGPQDRAWFPFYTTFLRLMLKHIEASRDRTFAEDAIIALIKVEYAHAVRRGIVKAEPVIAFAPLSSSGASQLKAPRSKGRQARFSR